VKICETGAELSISPTAAHEIVHDTTGYRRVSAWWVPMPQPDAYGIMLQAHYLAQINQWGISGDEDQFHDMEMHTDYPPRRSS
jgi:hypothetical protein